MLGLGLVSIAAAGEWINVQDARKLGRYDAIAKVLSERLAGRSAALQEARAKSRSSLDSTRARMTTASLVIGRTAADGRAASARGARNLAAGVPSDEYYIETARRNGLNVVRLDAGQFLDADTGGTARKTGGGVWSWVGKSGGSRRILTVRDGTVIELSDGALLELPAGVIIRAGDTIVIPPLGTPQRAFAPPPAKAPRAAPAEAPALIVIPVKPPKIRITKLRERGESIFGGHHE